MSVSPSWRDLTFKSLRTTDAPEDGYGLFEGYLAVFDNTDTYKDVIKKGAFAKTLQEAKSRRDHRATEGKYPVLLPLLWQHSQTTPIGGLTDASEDTHGLFVRGFVDTDTISGREAYSGMKKGYNTGLSIGYRTIKDAWKRDSGQDTRHLLEVQLLEGSLVTMPANDEAYVTAVKAASGKSDWPLAERGRPWNAGAAVKRLEAFAEGKSFASIMAGTHFYRDEAAPADERRAYKLPFCDVINGRIMAVPRAIFAVAGVLRGARGGGSFGGSDAAIRRRVAAYYQRMAEAFDDESLVPPWEGGKSVEVDEPFVDDELDALRNTVREAPETDIPDTPESPPPHKADDETLEAPVASPSTPDLHSSTEEPEASAGTPDTDWLVYAAVAGLARKMRQDVVLRMPETPKD